MKFSKGQLDKIRLIERFFGSFHFHRVDILKFLTPSQKHFFLKSFYVPGEIAGYKYVPLVYFLAGVCGSRSFRKKGVIIEISSHLEEDLLDSMDLGLSYYLRLLDFRRYFRSKRFKEGLGKTLSFNEIRALMFSVLLDLYQSLLENGRSFSKQELLDNYKNLEIKITPAKELELIKGFSVLGKKITLKGDNRNARFCSVSP